MADRLPGLHLQRRAGRRKSTPASPSSPTFQRKYGRSQDSTLPFFSASEVRAGAGAGAGAGIIATDSPSIDLTVPSPTFDLPTPSPSSLAGIGAPHNLVQPERLAEDVVKSGTNMVGANPYPLRIQTSYSPEAPTPKGSPLVGSQNASGDAPWRPPSRDTPDDASVQRAATFWAQYDRAAGEDLLASRTLTSTKKSRFNILNTMNLLARRRSSQNTNKLDNGEFSVSTLHVPAIPDNISPSIRGIIVHDFSEPRARRPNSDNSSRPGPTPSSSYPRRPSEIASPPVDSLGTPSSLHSPMFKEHFQEDQKPVNPANTAYLHGQNLHLRLPSKSALPSFAKNLPLTIPNAEEIGSHHADRPVLDINTTFVEDTELSQQGSPPPPTPPPKKTPSPVLELSTANAMPRHMASTSSRFSFLGQQGSIAQERFLEEKHKEHASKKPAPQRFSVASMDDMDEYAGYDALDDDEDDGFDNDEIMIRNIDMPSSQILQPTPAVTRQIPDFGYHEDDEFGTDDIVIRNIDVPTSLHRNEEETENSTAFSDTVFLGNHAPMSLKGLQSHRQSLQAFHFTPQSLTFSPSTAQFTTNSTPRDIEGFPIGMAHTKEGVPYDPNPRIRDSADQSQDAAFYEGLGISTALSDLSDAKDTLVQYEPFDDSDLYFDDGEFDENIDVSEVHFNEDILDDPSKIKDIPAENARRYEEALQRSLLGGKAKTLSNDNIGKGLHDASPELGELSELMQSNSTSTLETNQAGLTEDNLAAYHDALAMAANKAAADGRFNRNISLGQNFEDDTDSPFHNGVPVVSSRTSGYSANLMSSGISDEDGYGYDDEMEYEAMIAAANAEALENDDEGFYGQEFGFYARAHVRESVEVSNGGYFTSRGSNGVKRSHSGKNNFQEPSLTPITERSEWSARNSVASLRLHTGIAGGIPSHPSPCIAQLLERDSPIVDDEMSLSTLMKLRGRAFGGSSSSVNSMVERHHAHSSPLAHVSGHNAHSLESYSARMASSSPGMGPTSIAESEDEDDDGGRSTLTQNTPHKKHLQIARDTSHSSSEQIVSSPISRKGNHSRNSSGAESVSYAREDDGRWVLERRRTGDDGELEVIGREYLAGTRI